MSGVSCPVILIHGEQDWIAPTAQARHTASFAPEDFSGAENKSIELNLGPEPMQFTGASYLSHFALPNFFFHVTTAYNILRNNGVVIGKRDFLGKV